jgi:hypothetical protein
MLGKATLIGLRFSVFRPAEGGTTNGAPLPSEATKKSAPANVAALSHAHAAIVKAYAIVRGARRRRRGCWTVCFIAYLPLWWGGGKVREHALYACLLAKTIGGGGKGVAATFRPFERRVRGSVRGQRFSPIRRYPKAVRDGRDASATLRFSAALCRPRWGTRSGTLCTPGTDPGLLHPVGCQGVLAPLTGHRQAQAVGPAASRALIRPSSAISSPQE